MVLYVRKNAEEIFITNGLVYKKTQPNEISIFIGLAYKKKPKWLTR